MISKFLINNQENFLNHPIIQKSIHPGQYDKPDICWNLHKKDINSPIRKLMYKYLLPHIKLSQRKNILEIGCGTGWLLAEIEKYVPKNITGIEPSFKNFDIARYLYPKIKFYHSSFENFKKNKKYDIIYAIMVLSHFYDIEDFFTKCANLTNRSGKIIIIVPNYKYFQRNRPKYNMKIVYFKDQYAVNIKKDKKSLSQIIRKKEVYGKAAKKAGFSTSVEKFIKIDSELIRQDKKYKKLLGLPMFDLLIYKKIN